MAYLPIQVGSGYLVLEVDVADSPPAAPSNLVATAISASRIDLAWTDNSANEAGFVIERSPNGTTGWLALTPTTAPGVTSYADTGLTDETAYHYRVKATNAAGDSAYTSVASATTLALGASPTGREPMLAWTPARQGVWEQMKADYDANPSGTTLAIRLYARLAQLASYIGTPDQLSAGNGPIAALMYQITGDTAWADKGITVLVGNASALEPWSDQSRENLIELVLLFDWLYPAMSEPDKATVMARFHILAQAEIDNFVGRDSDQTTGGAFGPLAMMAHSAAAEYDPTIADYLDDAKIGGLDATATDQTTARNSIKSYLTQSSVGGEWCEGSEYNLGTTRLLAMLYASLKTATAPTDHLPEVAAELGNLPLIPLIQLTPALNQAIQWGDSQYPRDPEWYQRVCTLGMLAGIGVGTTGAEYALKLCHEQMIAQGYSGGQVFGRMMILIDPYATQTDWRSTLFSHYASGQGTLYVHDGWGTEDSLFFVRFEKRSPYVDHSMHHWGGFQLWRKAEWAITNPLGYWNNYKVGEWISLNQMGIGGLSWFAGNRGIIGQETVDGSYAYIAGYSDGKFFGLDEPEFCHENQRSIVYLMSASQTADVIVVFDRVDAVPPLSLSSSGQIDFLYGEPWATRIKASPYGADGLKQWVIHAPVAPTNEAHAITWDTAGGQHVRVDALLPASVTITNYDETTVLSGTDFSDSEKKWQARIKPATDQQWDTFLNVVQVYDGSSQPTVTLIESSAGQTYQGAQVARSGDDDAITMFGGRASAGNRLITTGTTFGWTQGTATATLVLCDLDPAKTWTYSLDGGGAASLTISANGVAVFTVNTAAAHTLVLTGA